MRRGMTPIQIHHGSLQHLFGDPPDAVLVDASTMETQNVSDIRQLRESLQVPVIIVAEGTSSDVVVQLLQAGADDVITEAASTDLVASRMGAILRAVGRREPTKHSPIVHLSGTEVDMGRRLVTGPRGSQPLSRTEFKLLEALLAAGGRTSSHRELVTRVWGVECASASHYLRLYIRYLRQKIESDPMRPRHILNVRGTGYRLSLTPEEVRLDFEDCADRRQAVTVSGGVG
jgi:two-component system KDP operon response regulator KdpE